MRIQILLKYSSSHNTPEVGANIAAVYYSNERELSNRVNVKEALRSWEGRGGEEKERYNIRKRGVTVMGGGGEGGEGKGRYIIRKRKYLMLVDQRME